jgi:hypothetical protein
MARYPISDFAPVKTQGDHRDFYQSDGGGSLGSQRSFLPHGYLTPAGKHRCWGERNRALYLLKSRGMEHSKQIREFVPTDDGLRVLDVYLGSKGMLTGSALAQHRY